MSEETKAFLFKMQAMYRQLVLDKVYTIEITDDGQALDGVAFEDAKNFEYFLLGLTDERPEELSPLGVYSGEDAKVKDIFGG